MERVGGKQFTRFLIQTVKRQRDTSWKREQSKRSGLETYNVTLREKEYLTKKLFYQKGSIWRTNTLFDESLAGIMARRTPRFRTNYIPVCIFNDWYTYFDRSSINREESRQTLQLILARLGKWTRVNLHFPRFQAWTWIYRQMTNSPLILNHALDPHGRRTNYCRPDDATIELPLCSRLSWFAIFDKGGISTRNDPLGPKFVLILVRSNGMDAA